MYISFIVKILSFFDYFKKKDVIDFFKKNLKKEVNILIDVGAHHGETIKLFNNNFDIKNIYAFEASYQNYKILKKKIQNIKNINLEIFNYGIGEIEGSFDFNQSVETQSSTLVSINYDSKYYKKKIKLLDLFKKKESFFSSIKVEIKTLSNFLNNKKIKYVEILKIDTEGYDFNVIKSLGPNIKNIKYIYFEHHFHDMLNKDYNLTQLHTFLIKNGFRKVFKMKMFYRKTFEYIYKNIKI